MEIVFKPASEDDYDAAYTLQTACHSFPWSRKQFLDCLNSPYYCYQMSLNTQTTLDTASTHNAKVIGYYVGLKVSVEATLMDIGIAKGYRGKGLGKELLKHFLRESNKRQAEEAWLEVRASNLTAISLYNEMEFEEIERRKNYYPLDDGREDALIMRLILGK